MVKVELLTEWDVKLWQLHHTRTSEMDGTLPRFASFENT